MKRDIGILLICIGCLGTLYSGFHMINNQSSVNSDSSDNKTNNMQNQSNEQAENIKKQQQEVQKEYDKKKAEFEKQKKEIEKKSKQIQSEVEKQKKENGEALISTVLFDNVSEVIHDRVPVQKVDPMTDRDYSVRGCTALLDAIGGAIHHIGNVHKYARKEDVPEHTLFVITTDGMENASRRYDSEKVKKMIERQKGKYGWEFLFLGANIDAVETAKHFGIGADRAVNYHSDREGTQLNYEVLSEAVSAVRCSVPLGTNWKKRIDEDFNSRKDGRK